MYANPSTLLLNWFYVSLMNLGFLFKFKLMAQKKLSSMIGQRQEKNLGKLEGYLLCGHVFSIDIWRLLNVCKLNAPGLSVLSKW